MERNKELFIIGAGNIGRAVVGSMFDAAGYHLICGDVAQELIGTMRRQGSFTVEFVGAGGSATKAIGGYDTVDMADKEAVVRAMDATDLVACCVYATAFDAICDGLAESIRRRRGSGRVLNVLLCVNALGAPEYFADKLAERLAGDDGGLAYLTEKTGLCQVLVIRAAIHPSAELLEKDPLAVTTTELGHLYIDAAAFKGSLPEVKDVSFVENIKALMERKIYTANMLHCMLAFMGWQKGYTLIPECLADREIRHACFAAFDESEDALAAAYGFDAENRKNWLETTMKPVDNANVKDEIQRVAANPIEKLAPDNRFAGPARMSEQLGKLPFYLAKGIAYGYCYGETRDAQAMALQSYIQTNGIQRAVRHFTGFPADSMMEQLILKHYDEIVSRKG